MKKFLKRFLALSLCMVLLVGLSACHRANERALKVDGSDYSAGYYSCALVFADIEGQQKVYDTLGATAAADYLNQTIDGVDYKTWVKNCAIEKCKQSEFFKSMCEGLMLDTSKYTEQYVELADMYWEYYGYKAIFEQNGVGRGTFRSYMGIDGYKDAYFDYIYGENGSKAVSKEDIATALSENFAVADMLTVSLTGKTETEAAEIEAKYAAYVKRLKENEKFEKIYAEVNGVAYTENKENEDTFSYDYATILGSDKTDYESEIFSQVKDMKIGEARLITKVNDEGKESETKTLYLVFKGDILKEGNSQAETLNNIALRFLKLEEFNETNEPLIKALEVEENEKITKQFKVDKIKYPTE